MSYQIQQVKLTLTICVIITLLSTFSSCNNKKNLNFNSPQDAINVCRSELFEVKAKQSANIKELTSYVSDWQIIQDSVYSYMSKHHKGDQKNQITQTFFLISDSVRSEITRLAFSEPRSMADVIYLKENTAFNRDKIISSDNYKEAKSFFADLDDENLFKGARQTLEEYAWLMTHTTNRKFSTENDFKEFLKQEDVCFRSFLENINQIPPEAVKKLTIETSNFCQNLYQGKNVSFMSPDKLTLFMTMRFNRRVLQNASIYQKYIEDGKSIPVPEVGNYRWTLIQPMFAIDNYSMATMTDSQMDQLRELADKLPELLAYIDNQAGASNQQSQQLQSALTKYFLTSYLQNTL